MPTLLLMFPRIVIDQELSSERLEARSTQIDLGGRNPSEFWTLGNEHVSDYGRVLVQVAAAATRRYAVLEDLRYDQIE